MENSWPISVGATVPFYAPGSAGRTGNGGGWGQVSCNFRAEDGLNPKAQPGSIQSYEKPGSAVKDGVGNTVLSLVFHTFFSASHKGPHLTAWAFR